MQIDIDFDFNQLSGLTAQDILFIVGAGISKKSPSNIPLGSELTRYILDISCGYNISKIFWDTWDKFSQTIKNYDEKLEFPIPRLETILGCINELDHILDRNHILSGIKHWSQTPPNSNHHILSDFVNHGSNIITTNFDLGIENAYENKYGSLIHQVVGSISVFKTASLGGIYHIHGCAFDDIDKLGATVKNVKIGFNETTEKTLSNIIHNSKLIIILGYSVSDSFDVTPFFQSIDCPPILFIQHISNTDKASIRFPMNLNKIVTNSTSSIATGYETDSFLSELRKYILALTPYHLEIMKEFDWKFGFEQSKPLYNDNDQLINFLGLRYHIGISTDVFKSIRPNIINDINIAYAKLDITNSKIDDYYAQAVRSFSEWKSDSINQPANVINEKVDYIDRAYLILLRDECQYYISKYANLSAKISDEDYARMDWLLMLLKEYTSYSYKKVQYVSYIMSVLKFASLFTARMNKGYHPEYAFHELLLSLDISYIEGAIASLIHQVHHYVVNDALNNNPFLHIEEENKMLSVAFKLAKLSGYEYHIKRISNIICSYNLPIDMASYTADSN